MLDTRLLGRDKQLAQADLSTASGQATWQSPARQLLGKPAAPLLLFVLRRAAWRARGQRWQKAALSASRPCVEILALVLPGHLFFC